MPIEFRYLYVDITAALKALQQKLEYVSECYVLFFWWYIVHNGHHLSKILVQKQSPTRESPIEKGYCNNIDRQLKLKPIYIHYREGDSSNFLYCLPQLRVCCMTEGYNCFPICTACLSSRKKVVNGDIVDNMQTRREKITKANATKW